MPTIYDVAAHAGVSISTVSRVLNASPLIAEATRQRVLESIDALGFIPKSDAVLRARRQLGRIGVVAPFSSYSSFGERLSGVFTATRGSTTEVVVFDQESAATVRSPLLSSLPLTQRLDGLIIMALPLDDAVAARLGRLPVVLVDSEHPAFTSVNVDDREGGRIAAHHLLERGFTTFAYVGEAQRSHAYVSQSEHRLAGFQEALARAGSHLRDDRVLLTDGTIDGTAAVVLDMVASSEERLGIFAHDDTIAAGVLRAAQRTTHQIGADIGIVGFDSSELANALGLTSVRQPLHESGAVATRLLRERIARPDTALQHVQLGLELIPRETT